MTEKDKIIDIILIADVTERVADSIADALIENGIGDINNYKCEAEYWEKAYYEKLSEYTNICKSSAKTILELTKDRDEWKSRVEIAERNDKIKERALENESRYCEIMMGFAKDEQDLEKLVQNRIENAKKQAEKEIEEKQ